MSKCLDALLERRRSVRQYTDEALSRETLESLIAAAIQAPSASNRQPWRFLVVCDAKVRGELADLVEAAAARVGEHVSKPFSAAYEDYRKYFVHFREAPAVIVPLYRDAEILGRMVGPTVDPRDRASIELMESRTGIVSTALAVENLLLKATELGLGTSMMTGPLVAEAALRERLDVKASWHILAFVAVGVPAETPNPTVRKEVAQVIRWVE